MQNTEHESAKCENCERLRAALFKIQCEQLRIATATDMTRPAMREAAMDTRNEIIKVLAVEQSKDGSK